MCFASSLSRLLLLSPSLNGKGKGGAPFSLIVEDVAEENNVGVPLSANKTLTQHGYHDPKNNTL